MLQVKLPVVTAQVKDSVLASVADVFFSCKTELLPVVLPLMLPVLNIQLPLASPEAVSPAATAVPSPVDAARAGVSSAGKSPSRKDATSVREMIFLNERIMILFSFPAFAGFPGAEV